MLSREFLTLLKDVKRLKIIAEVTNKLPNTIYDIVGSGIIENKGNVRKVIVFVFIYCYRCFLQVLNQINQN